MTTSNTDNTEWLKEEIKYRVSEEYKKYHNDVAFEHNSKDFWIEQIIWKLAKTIQSGIEAKYISREEVEEVIADSMSGFEEGGEAQAIMNTTLTEIRTKLNLKPLKEKI